MDVLKLSWSVEPLSQRSFLCRVTGPKNPWLLNVHELRPGQRLHCLNAQDTLKLAAVSLLISGSLRFVKPTRRSLFLSPWHHDPLLQPCPALPPSCCSCAVLFCRGLCHTGLQVSARSPARSTEREWPSTDAETSSLPPAPSSPLAPWSCSPRVCRTGIKTFRPALTKQQSLRWDLNDACT